MKKHNSVKIDKNVKKSPITAGNGNIVVSGNKMKGDHNTITIIINRLIKFRYYIISVLLFGILFFVGLRLQKPPVTNVNITNVPSVQAKEEPKSTLNPFKEGIYGIIVAQFNGNTEEQKNKGKEIQATIQSTLNARFKELGINDADARKIPDLFESHELARNFGKKYQAQLVIWGDVTLKGIIPNITIVNEESDASQVMEPETAILKDSLTHTSLAETKDIRLPALTDEPTKLVSFVTGQRYFFKGNFEKAVEYFTYSLPEKSDKYIDSSVIFFERGVAYGYLIKPDNSIEDFTRSISLNPKDDKAYYNRGIVYHKKGDYDKAISDYTQAISLNPKLYQAYYNRGITYKDKGEYDKAISDYTQAISLNPKLYQAYNNRGNAYYLKGEYDKAIEDFNQAISLNPKYDFAYNNRGSAYGKKGYYDRAIADYTQAISLNPTDHKIYFRRGVSYEKQGIYDKAIDDFNQAIKLTPQFSLDLPITYNSTSWLLSTCHDAQYRDGNKAIKFAQKALEIEPNNPAILDTLAAAYAEAGKFEEAVTTQKKAMKMLNEKDKDKYLSEFTEHLNFYKARKPWREKPSQKSNLN